MSDAAPPDTGVRPGSIRSAGHAAVQWLLGDAPVHEREPDSGTLAVMVCTVGVIAMWLGTKHSLHGSPITVGAWRMLVHGGVPLASVAGWEIRAAWRRGERGFAPLLITLVGMTVLLAPVVLRFSATSAKLLAASPLTGLILPAAVGAALVILGLGQTGARLKDWGIGFGDWRWWLPHHGLLLLALIPLVALTTWLVPPLAHYYPMYKPARTSFTALEMSMGGLALDLLGWEFLFRGFLLFGIARRGDAVMAALLQAVPFFLLHSPKPELEMGSSFVGGVFAGWFCLSARSFFPLYVIHVAIITTVSVTAFWLRN